MGLLHPSSARRANLSRGVPVRRHFTRVSSVLVPVACCALWAPARAWAADDPAAAGASDTATGPTAPDPNSGNQDGGNQDGGLQDRAQLRIEIEGEKGDIFVDGEEVGHGRYIGELSAGRHTIRVTREGHDPYEKELVLAPGEVRSESVTLKPAVGEVEKPGSLGMPDALDGIYGGVQLLAAFVPRGRGNTFQDSCDSIGATRCGAGSVTAGGLSAYVGYMLEPIGLELALLGSGDLSNPSATFDGVKGSEINPVVASPAREEKFTIAGFGGGAALRARFATRMSRFRFSFAAGPGLAYRMFAMRREAESTDGRTGYYADVGASYVSALLSLEASAALELGGSTALSLGLISWFEHAGDDTRSRAEERSVLTSNNGAPPIPHATPRYELANGAQWFVGPFLGLTFGP